MLRRLRCALAVVAAAFGVAQAASAAIQVSVRPSRTTGVAPLAVHFDATGTASTGIRAFHDLKYTWRFGDSTAGSWAQNALPKNAAFGPVAAHVFETPGTFDVTLQVSDASGQVASANVTITVADPNAAFGGANTICVSTSGVFSGCPSGARTSRTASFEAAISLAATGTRVLLRRGDIFPSNATATLGAPGPGTIGAYGTGAAPLISSPRAAAVLRFNSVGEDWRLMDLEFAGPAISGSIAFQDMSALRRLLFLRVSVRDFHSGAVFGYGKAEQLQQAPLHTEVFFVDSHFQHFTGGAGGNGVFAALDRSAILGSVVEDSRGAEHVVRLPHASWLVFSNNTIADAAKSKHLLKLHAIGETSPALVKRSHDIVISGNTFVGGDGGWDVTIGPQDQLQDERIRDVLVERNLFRSSPMSATNLVVWASEVSIGHNVFDLSATLGGKATAISQRGIEPPPNTVHFDNNTCFTSSGSVTCASLGGSNHRAYNNVAIGAAGSAAITGAAQLSTNLTLASRVWAASAPVSLLDYRPDPARATALVDRGTAIASSTVDAAGAPINIDGDGDGVRAWDIGAFEIAGSGGSGGGGTPSPPAAPVLLP